MPSPNRTEPSAADMKMIPGGPGRPGGGAGQIGGMGGARFRAGNEKPRDFKRTLRRILGLFSAEKKTVAVIMGLAVFDAALVLTAPRLVGKAVDAMGLSGDLSVLLRILAALALAYVCSAALSFSQSWLVASATQRMVHAVRVAFFGKFDRLPLRYFDTRSHGDIMSRLANDTDALSLAVSQSVVSLLGGSITVLGSLAMMLILSPALSLVALASAPLLFLLSATIARHTKPLFKAQQATLGKLNGHIEEMATNLSTVRVYGREAGAMDRFAGLNGELCDVGAKAQVWAGFLMPLMNVINNLSFAGIALVGGLLAAGGSIAVGTIASFLVYSRQFIRPLNEIANMATALMSALAGAERVFEVLDEAEERADTPESVAPQDVRGDIDFDDVTFSYASGPDAAMALDHASFAAPAGSCTAIVGPTGAGKTTMVNLLSRFYDAQSGQVRLDGVVIQNYSRVPYRRQFGVVLQDAWLFPGTIRDNLRYGKPDADEATLRRACEAAGALPFIERLPAGFDTVLSENGSELSHGRRQLLAIARAALAEPGILVLDEATGSLDTRTEIHVQKGLRALMRDRTTFVIAHRLSTIRDADRILVMDNGKIMENGTHEELLELQGLYSRLYRAQLSGDFE